VKLYEASERPSWISISQCLVFLDQPAEVAAILHRLLGSSEVCFNRCTASKPLHLPEELAYMSTHHTCTQRCAHHLASGAH
jgi:hypothetical protein